jgi:hypothetical protein
MSLNDRKQNDLKLIENQNFIFHHFYTDDPLAEIIGREMILWQD